nr:hypothetical protein [Spirochaeta sp.]
MKKKIKYIWRAVLLSGLLPLFIFVSCVSAPQEEEQTGSTAVEMETLSMAAPLPLDPSLISGRLENGLTYYIRSNETPEKRAELRLVVN